MFLLYVVVLFSFLHSYGYFSFLSKEIKALSIHMIHISNHSNKRIQAHAKLKQKQILAK